MERISGPVCFKISPGCYMKHRLTIKSCYTVSTTIPNVVIVKTQILPCSSWSNVPTLTYKMQRASRWSTSCNIRNLAQQQTHHKIQWSMLQSRIFCHFRQAYTANQPSFPLDEAIKGMKAQAAWMQKGYQHWEHCAAYYLKRSFQRTKDQKLDYEGNK